MNLAKLMGDKPEVAMHKTRVAIVAAALYPSFSVNTKLELLVETARLLIDIADQQVDKELEETPAREGL